MCAVTFVTYKLLFNIILKNSKTRWIAGFFFFYMFFFPFFFYPKLISSSFFFFFFLNFFDSKLSLLIFLNIELVENLTM
jgi:hypothetical protein